jgi:hypothetical protein
LEVEKKSARTLFFKKELAKARKAEDYLFCLSFLPLQLLWTLTRTKGE